MTDEIIIEGARYFHAHGVGEYHNPYPRGSDEYDCFERGWTQALKKSHAFSEEHPRSSKSDYPIIIPAKPQSIDQKISDYRKRKG